MAEGWLVVSGGVRQTDLRLSEELWLKKVKP